MAARFSEAFDSKEWGLLAGRWHDLGKYSGDFQSMIRSATGIDAHLETLPGKVDHSSAGAVLARQLFGKSLGHALSAVIAGHHAGLADLNDLDGRLEAKASRLASALLSGEAKRDGFSEAAQPVPPPFLRRLKDAERKRAFDVWVRLLYSALVDADSLDTEEFHQPARPAERASPQVIAALATRLDLHVAQLGANKHGAVADLRREIQSAARSSAQLPPGYFTLTVPTGGGKTFASAQFALAHAHHHGMRRAIIIPPFSSIIEQTAAALRGAVGPGAVIEHHSALDPKNETPWAALASENWDSPIVVSTAVQFFESLFANRRTPCRKLHNIARSVIVLDEAQTLPIAFLGPILDVLKALVRDYGCSIVFSTATQPALGKREAFPIGLEGMHEIAPAPKRAADRLRRVDVRWPQDLDAPVSWADLASRIAGHDQALAIVHRKDDARLLTDALDLQVSGEPIYLTTNLCAAHRSQALGSIRERLRDGAPVRVVATQLIEAGVDVDFPVVFRALGGLDSLAQAAGRCNREGLRARGQLEVFVAPSLPPPGTPLRGFQEAKGMLRANPALDLFAPDTFDEYFRRLFFGAQFDPKGIQGMREGLQFKAVAEAFQLIEDGVPVAVHYAEGHELIAALRRQQPNRQSLRALQRYTVNVAPWQAKKLEEAGALELVAGAVLALADSHQHLYSARFGLQLTGTIAPDPDSLHVSS